MHLFLWEMKSNFKGLLIWCASVIFLVASAMAEFSAYYNNPDMTKILEAMPKELLDALNMNATNLTTVSGYYTVIVLYFIILLGIHAATLGNLIISKEERDKTVEFLFALPISREKVVMIKLVAAIVNSVILLGVTNAAFLIAALNYEVTTDLIKFVLRADVALFLIQLIFLTIGMLMAAFFKRHKLSSRLSLTIAFTTYILSIIMGITDKLNRFKFLTPYKYFDLIKISQGSHVAGFYLYMSMAIISIAIALIFYIYPRRDLRA
jgi:ABC-2 type transport system permease protein